MSSVVEENIVENDKLSVIYCVGLTILSKKVPFPVGTDECLKWSELLIKEMNEMREVYLKKYSDKIKICLPIQDPYFTLFRNIFDIDFRITFPLSITDKKMFENIYPYKIFILLECGFADDEAAYKKYNWER